MAYAKTNSIANMGPQGGANHKWFYVDGDALDVMDGSGYFDLEADKLQVNDVIECVGNGVIGFLRVNAISSGVVDCDNAIPLPVAVIDSD